MSEELSVKGEEFHQLHTPQSSPKNKPACLSSDPYLYPGSPISKTTPNYKSSENSERKYSKDDSFNKNNITVLSSISDWKLTQESPQKYSSLTTENKLPNNQKTENIPDILLDSNRKLVLNKNLSNRSSLNADAFIDQIARNSEFIKKGYNKAKVNPGIRSSVDVLINDLDLLEYDRGFYGALCCKNFSDLEKIVKLKTENLNKNKRSEVFNLISKEKKCESWVFNENMSLVDLHLMADVARESKLYESDLKLMCIFNAISDFTSYFIKRVTQKKEIKANDCVQLPRYVLDSVKHYLLCELQK